MARAGAETLLAALVKAMLIKGQVAEKEHESEFTGGEAITPLITASWSCLLNVSE